MSVSTIIYTLASTLPGENQLGNLLSIGDTNIAGMKWNWWC